MKLVYFSNKYHNLKNYIGDKKSILINYFDDPHNVETLGVTLATVGILCYYIIQKIQERSKG